MWSWSPPSLLQKEGRKVTMTSVCPSLVGKWMGVAMVTPISFPEERREGGHDLWLTLLGQCRSVSMAILITLSEGNW